VDHFLHFQPTNLLEKIGLIILYDQITRNIYRGSAKAYEHDSIARDIALELSHFNDQEKLLIDQTSVPSTCSSTNNLSDTTSTSSSETTTTSGLSFDTSESRDNRNSDNHNRNSNDRKENKNNDDHPPDPLDKKSNLNFLRLPLHFQLTITICLLHSETLAHHDLVSKLLDVIRWSRSLDGNLFTSLKQIAINHRDRIVMFGRIPERNRYLKRISTSQELAFMSAVGKNTIF